MKWQIEVFMPSRNKWMNFYTPFDTELMAQEFMIHSFSVIISKCFGDNFDFRIVYK